ncbi:unnamed protein product, partial [Gongylonema pulchrum]|uniref:Fucokinase domain-containing protein n=1 Tax=Gongylonema pulchrum TaxID=637853 RepID=A0A183EPB1_9BILA
MDCGLLGEGIACSLYDALKRQIAFSPIIIPQKVNQFRYGFSPFSPESSVHSHDQATVYGCIIECPAVTDENIAIFGGQRFVSDSVLSPYNAKDISMDLEPYWCCAANEIRGGYKILSEVVEIFNISFAARSQLEKLNEHVVVDLHTAPITCSGTAHSIMAWFRCELFPGAPILNTSPESKSCWQQAFYPLPKPLYLEKGFLCTLEVNAFRDHLLCSLRNVIVPEN